MDQRKKSINSLEQKRGLFFRIGLIVSLGMVLLAFDWKSKYDPHFPEDLLLEPEEFLDAVIVMPKQEELKEEIAKPLDLQKQARPVPVVLTPVPDKKVITQVEPPATSLVVTPRVRPNPNTGPRLGADKMPEYKGGFEAMKSFIRNGIRYPGMAISDRLQGTVWVSFVVNSHGMVVDVSIKKGIREDMDREAMRIVQAMPDWIPAENKGYAVAVIQVIPIKFTIVRD